MPRFELLEAIHPSDVSQIAPGEVVSCNYLPNPALWKQESAGARSVRGYVAFEIQWPRE